MKQLIHNDIEWTLECLPEYEPFEGNVSASGDDDVDAAAEQWVADQLDQGNEWAWCTVKVTGTFEGIEVSDYLGGCSYVSERDFVENSGYFEDMQAQVLNEINERLESIAARVCEG